MMSHKSKRELINTVHPRYYAATRREKKLILDELEANTGYHRKYAIRLLRHGQEVTVRRKRRTKRRYTLPVQAALVKVWRAANCICAKRLVPCLEWFVSAMERHDELSLDAETRRLLLAMSPATADRLLRHERQANVRRGLSTTKPGTLLKQSIKSAHFCGLGWSRSWFLRSRPRCALR